MLPSHGISVCLGVLHTFYFPHEGRYFRSHWLTSSSCNTNSLCGQAFLHNQLAQIRHNWIKICAIHIWLGTDSIDCGLQLRAFDAFEEVADLGAIIHSTIAIICNVHHDGMLFFVEGNILVPIPCLSLTIKIKILQLFFCICGLPDHMDRAKKMLVDVKDHSSTILHASFLFQIDKCIHVREHHSKHLIHHLVVNLECIGLVVTIEPIK